MIHTSVHQPVDDKIPGLGLGPFGQWFTRHETWAEQAGPWMSYLARSSYMLQQGKFVADVLYVYGEAHNITALFGNRLPDIPEGYNYDFVNAGAIGEVLSVVNGRLSTPGGTEYRLLALDASTRYMSLPALKKIKELVYDGAIVTGPKPVNTPIKGAAGKRGKTARNCCWGVGCFIPARARCAGKDSNGKTRHRHFTGPIHRCFRQDCSVLLQFMRWINEIRKGQNMESSKQLLFHLLKYFLKKLLELLRSNIIQR